MTIVGEIEVGERRVCVYILKSVANDTCCFKVVAVGLGFMLRKGVMFRNNRQ